LNFNSLGGAWRHVSKDAKDFLLKMLEKDPEKRASAVQLLQHKWIKEKAKLPQVSPEHSEEIMNNLKNYKVFPFSQMS
jgi:serine/threonine protein kinase